MTDIAVRDDHSSDLEGWAQDAATAARLAVSLAKTSHARAFNGNHAEIAAAILAGKELGLPPIVAVGSIDIIQGTPTLRTHAMRALVQREGHSVQLVESTPTVCRMRGRRRGEDEWQEVVWTIERAAQLGLTGKTQWKSQPQTMLVARATGEICRLIASDVLRGMPYSSDEVDRPAGPTRARVSMSTILAQPEPEPEPVDVVTAAEVVEGFVTAEHDPTIDPDWPGQP